MGDRNDVTTQRDTAWFEELYGRRAPLVHAYARRRLEQPEDAEDVLVEVFTVAWRRRADIPTSDDEVLPWLYATAANAIAHTRRSYARRIRLHERAATAAATASTTSTGGDPQADVAQRLDDEASLANVWPLLPPGDQEVLRLWAWEGLDGPRLAIALGCSHDAARTRLSRARNRLRTALTSQAGSPDAKDNDHEPR